MCMHVPKPRLFFSLYLGLPLANPKPAPTFLTLFFGRAERRSSSSLPSSLMAEKGETKFDSESAACLVKELRQVFRSGKTRSYDWRIHQLKMLIRLTDENERQIMDALREDLNKSDIYSFLHEISIIKASCELPLKELKHWMKPQKVKTTLTTYPSSAELVPEPLGIALVISSWNFPFLLSLNPVIGAIAAGNAVVLKPSESAPATSSLLATLLPKYLDSSAIKVIEGSVAETTALLDQQWDKIFYTGNGRVGRIVMSAAAKHLTPVVLELGGKSPVVVDSNVDLEVAAKRIVAGKWGSTNGQACIAPDYIITPKSFAPKLIDALKSTLESFYGKEPLNSMDLARIVNINHFARLARLIDDEKVAGKIVHGGQRDEKLINIAPTILLDVPRDSLIMGEEIFGPLLPIITVDKVEQSWETINCLGSKPLAAYLFTKDKKVEKEFVSSICAGGILINDTCMQYGNPHLPFGGVGESGMGCYQGKFSFDAFTHMKPVLYRSFKGEFSTRYPPFTPQKQKLLRSLLNFDIIGIILAILGWHK